MTEAGKTPCGNGLFALAVALVAACAPASRPPPLALPPPPVMPPLELSDRPPSPIASPPAEATPPPAARPSPALSLSCPGSIALVYHYIDTSGRAPVCDKHGITATHKSFRKVLGYLARQGYRFPDPAEFAADIADGACQRRYAIVIIDDPWNDPRKMRVPAVLERLRRKHPESNANVWWAIVTRQVDSWKRVARAIEGGLIHPISHSLNHPLDPPLSRLPFAEAAREIEESRRELAAALPGHDPLFFVFPGGSVTPELVEVARAHYAGAFGVRPGFLDGADPALLPRINGGCRKSASLDNSAAVIGRIRQELKRDEARRRVP